MNYPYSFLNSDFVKPQINENIYKNTYKNPNENQKFEKNIENPSILEINKQNNKIDVPQTTLETYQNNLNYYNLPFKDNTNVHYSKDLNINDLPQNNIGPINPTSPVFASNNITIPPNINNVIKNPSSYYFEPYTNTEQDSHQIKHVLECEHCKNILIKQFNIENDKQKYDEMLEIISYVLYGLFILYLIDMIKKK